MWEFLDQYINSDKEYEIRFALVMYLNYFLTDEYIDRILEKVDKVINKEYYVQMATAWLISYAYIKQKDKTEEYLLKNNLDVFTQNKSIQKICESYRVNKNDKEKILYELYHGNSRIISYDKTVENIFWMKYYYKKIFVKISIAIIVVFLFYSFMILTK